MGRGKIEIKKIENANSRQVTFSKRRSGLFKKAHELAVLCEADVAVIIFSNTGRLFDFSSTSMRNILSRYKRCLEITKAPPRSLEYRPQRQEPEESKEADILKQEIEKLKLKQMRLLGKSLDGMDLLELGALEQQLSEGLIYIKQRKEEALMQQLEHYRDQEQKIMLENETLRKQVQELQAFFPSTSSPSMLCIEYNATVEKTDPVIKEGSGSPEMACDGGIADDEELADDEDSDTTLQLGPPTRICRKRKTMDGETQSLRLD